MPPRARFTCPVSAAFGRRCRRLREEQGLTRRQLAGVAGLSPAVVTLVEKGANTTLATASALAKALGEALPSMLDPDGCPNCHGAVRRGFACLECGAGGPVLAGVESAGLRLAEPGVHPVPDGEAR